MLTFLRYTAEAKDSKKIFKKEAAALNPIKDKFPVEKGKIDYKVIPALNDFVILAKPNKAGSKSIHVYVNETFITEVEADFNDLHFTFTDKGALQSILLVDSNTLTGSNSIQYKFCQEVDKPQEKKKEWTWIDVSHQMINKQFNCCFPYIYFIYNHD